MSAVITSFLDGPAKQHQLSLSRTPILLRVVTSGGSVDALDRLDDQAAPGESIVVYILTGPTSCCFVDGVDPKTRRRWGEVRQSASYRLLTEQPDDATLRDNARWTEWVRANGERLTPEFAKGKTVMPGEGGAV